MNYDLQSLYTSMSPIPYGDSLCVLGHIACYEVPAEPHLNGELWHLVLSRQGQGGASLTGGRRALLLFSFWQQRANRTRGESSASPSPVLPPSPNVDLTWWEEVHLVLSWHKHKHSNGRSDMPFGGRWREGGRRDQGWKWMDGWTAENR